MNAVEFFAEVIGGGAWGVLAELDLDGCDNGARNEGFRCAPDGSSAMWKDVRVSLHDLHQ